MNLYERNIFGDIDILKYVAIPIRTRISMKCVCVLHQIRSCTQFCFSFWVAPDEGRARGFSPQVRLGTETRSGVVVSIFFCWRSLPSMWN